VDKIENNYFDVICVAFLQKKEKAEKDQERRNFERKGQGCILKPKIYWGRNVRISSGPGAII
jgi:hypothetical protein